MILLVFEYVGEHAGEHSGKLAKSASELVAAAKALGREGPIAALVMGSGVASAANAAAALAEQVLVADRPELAEYDAQLWSAAVAQIAAEGGAHTILIAGSRAGREYSPRVAVKLDAALLEDVISLAHADGVTTAERYACLARVTEKVETRSPVVVATIKPGALSAAGPAAAAGEQFDVELKLPPRRVEVIAKTAEKSSRVALADADIVVSGGRGVGSAEGFTKFVEALADQLGAAVGATRAVVDAGWRPYSEQVGQTGKTVQPKAYLAVGISGAVQHLSGMNKSKYILAINSDPDAPIFKIADCGIPGDVSQVVPAILKKLKERK
jgi:electron transfer flavoprotein alpha subunit